MFLGNIEGQLVIRPYLARLARTELFILMTVGLSVIAGTVFVLYATILKDVLPGALGHLLVASLMSLPAGVLMARIMVPGWYGAGSAFAGWIRGSVDRLSELQEMHERWPLFRTVLSNSFPRTFVSFSQAISAGRTGWLKFGTVDDRALWGAVLNFNPNATTNAGAFRQGHNLHALTLTDVATITVPVFTPSCQ